MSEAENLKKNPKRARSPRSGSEIVAGNPGNSGGKKGRSGRKPLAFKALCADILNDPVTQQGLRAVAADPAAPGYAVVMKMLASYAEGLPAQAVQVTGADGGPVQVTVTRRIVRPNADD